MRFRALAVTSLVVLALLAVAAADEFPMKASDAVPAATGKIKADTDRNGNTALELKFEHLAPPDRLNPAKTTYVVWAKPSEDRPPEKLGVVRVNPEDMAATVKATVPYKKFDVLVTAEDNANVDHPSGTEVLRGFVDKK
ncbi:MAG TPA: hypothetical protein VFA60_01885 [Terriglobales bacterium]|nr:hypothetical protein [Terriglobales bacterium]